MRNATRKPRTRTSTSATTAPTMHERTFRWFYLERTDYSRKSYHVVETPRGRVIQDRRPARDHDAEQMPDGKWVRLHGRSLARLLERYDDRALVQHMRGRSHTMVVTDTPDGCRVIEVEDPGQWQLTPAERTHHVVVFDAATSRPAEVQDAYGSKGRGKIELLRIAPVLDVVSEQMRAGAHLTRTGWGCLVLSSGGTVQLIVRLREPDADMFAVLDVLRELAVGATPVYAPAANLLRGIGRADAALLKTRLRPRLVVPEAVRRATAPARLRSLLAKARRSA